MSGECMETLSPLARLASTSQPIEDFLSPSKDNFLFLIIDTLYPWRILFSQNNVVMYVSFYYIASVVLTITRVMRLKATDNVLFKSKPMRFSFSSPYTFSNSMSV